MNEFISVYHFVFGTRPTEGSESNSKNLDAKFVLRENQKPVQITRIVCAIEDKDCKTYHFDRYGRFGIAKNEDKPKIKMALAAYYRSLTFSHPDEFNQYKEHMSDFEMAPEWHSFGWLIDELPDFEACYQKWKEANGVSGKSLPPLQNRNFDPSPQNHIWINMSKILKNVVGEQAHQLIKLGDYQKAIKNLEDKGLRWSESEKKALRRSLRSIVVSAE
jgi:hypothetical protein